MHLRHLASALLLGGSSLLAQADPLGGGLRIYNWIVYLP